jgi:DNA-binding IclR family transcriptional regulator
MPVSLRLGDVMPLLSSATGRCFAAFIGHGGAADKALPMIDAELALARKLGRSDLPSTPAQVHAMLSETRAQGLGRVVNVLLPGISGLCAPVFDSDGHLVLGVVSLGSSATLDADCTAPWLSRCVHLPTNCRPTWVGAPPECGCLRICMHGPLMPIPMTHAV